MEDLNMIYEKRREVGLKIKLQKSRFCIRNIEFLGHLIEFDRLRFFFSSRRRHTRLQGDWSSDVCSSDLETAAFSRPPAKGTAGIPDSSSKNQKTEATQQPGSEIFVDGGQQFPREFQKQLAWRRTKLDRTRRVEVIQHFIAGIFQSPQCRLFAAIVKVRIHLSP